jgi:hypothetical protein
MSTDFQLPPLSERLADTVKGFWHLGLTAFGGPGTFLQVVMDIPNPSISRYTHRHIVSSLSASVVKTVFENSSAGAAGSSNSVHGSIPRHLQTSSRWGTPSPGPAQPN